MFDQYATIEDVCLALVHRTQNVWVDNTIPQSNEMRDDAAHQAAERIKQLTH